MRDYVKFLFVITLTLFIFACSNNDETAEEDGAAEGGKQVERLKAPVRPEFDFRKTRWGMSREEVLAHEPGKPIFNTENSLEYQIFIGDIQAQANYKFDGDKLIRAGYHLPRKYEDMNEYLDKYEKIKAMIIESKGSPMIDKEVQLDPSEEIDPDKKGEAACEGKLVYGTQWKHPGSDIQLLLRGENSECYLTVIYLKNVPDEPDEDTATAN